MSLEVENDEIIMTVNGEKGHYTINTDLWLNLLLISEVDVDKLKAFIADKYFKGEAEQVIAGVQRLRKFASKENIELIKQNKDLIQQYKDLIQQKKDLNQKYEQLNSELKKITADIIKYA